MEDLLNSILPKSDENWWQAIYLGFSILRIAEDQRCSKFWELNK